RRGIAACHSQGRKGLGGESLLARLLFAGSTNQGIGKGPDDVHIGNRVAKLKGFGRLEFNRTFPYDVSLMASGARGFNLAEELGKELPLKDLVCLRGQPKIAPHLLEPLTL